MFSSVVIPTVIVDPNTTEFADTIALPAGTLRALRGVLLLQNLDNNLVLELWSGIERIDVIDSFGGGPFRFEYDHDLLLPNKSVTFVMVNYGTLEVPVTGGWVTAEGA